MKKFLKFTLVIFALFIISFSVNIYGQDYNYLNYEINEGKVTILSLADETVTNVVIPSTIESNPVTEIVDYAFSSNYQLETIEIPSSVTKIGNEIMNKNAYKIPIFIVEENSYAENFVKENNFYYQYDKNLTHILKTKVTKIESYVYTGSEIKPKIELKDNDTVLTEGVDYTLEYSNNKEVGTGTIKVKGIGNYTGTKNYNFQIRGPNVVDIIYSALPDNLDLNIKEVEYDKVDKILEEKIKKICSDNEILIETSEEYMQYIYLKVSKNNISVNISITNPYFYTDLKAFYQVGVSISSSDVKPTTYYESDYGKIYSSTVSPYSLGKSIQIKYSNVNNLQKDEKLDKMQFEQKKVIKLNLEKVVSTKNEDKLKLIIEYVCKYYTDLVNDKDVIVKALAPRGGGPICNMSADIVLGIFKNDLLYTVKKTGFSVIIPELEIDKKMSNEELLQYIKSIIGEYDKTYAESIKTIEVGIKGNNFHKITTDELPDAYTLISGSDNNETYEYISIKVNIKDVEKKDEESNITLISNTNVVPNNVVLEVKNIVENDSVYKDIKVLLSDSVSKLKVFDINLLCNGVKVQPNGKVKISIPIPDGFDASKLVVYRIENDGSKTLCNSYIENDMIVIETDHFSNYVIGEKSSSKEDITTTEKPADYKSNPDTGRIILSYTDLSVVNAINF